MVSTASMRWGFGHERGPKSDGGFSDRTSHKPYGPSATLHTDIDVSPYGFQVPSASARNTNSFLLDDILARGLGSRPKISRGSSGSAFTLSTTSSRLNAWDSRPTFSCHPTRQTRTLYDLPMHYSKEESKRKMEDNKRVSATKASDIKRTGDISRRQCNQYKEVFESALNQTVEPDTHSVRRESEGGLSSLPALSSTETNAPSYAGRSATNGPTAFGSPLYRPACVPSSKHSSSDDSAFNHMKGKPSGKIEKRIRTISNTHQVVSNSSKKGSRHSSCTESIEEYILMPIPEAKKTHKNGHKKHGRHEARILKMLEESEGVQEVSLDDADDNKKIIITTTSNVVEVKSEEKPEKVKVKTNDNGDDDIEEDIWVESEEGEEENDESDEEDEELMALADKEEMQEQPR